MSAPTPQAGGFAVTRTAIIVPSRDRPESVARMIQAWNETGAWGAMDLYWAIDADDPKCPEYIKALDASPGGPRMHISGEWEPMVPKLNRVALALADGIFGAPYDQIGFMGDDHLPRTLGWAQRIPTEMATSPKPLIVYGRDGLQDEALPTWWVMDARIVRALRRMVPAPVQHLYCDNAIAALGLAAGCLRYLGDILVEHMHPVAGKAEMDDGYYRVNRRQQYERDEAAYAFWLQDGINQDVASVLAS